MRKILYVIVLAPVLLSLACNLQMPNAVQVKGSPDFRFSANFDISEYLKEFINKDSFNTADKVELLDCVNKDIVTYLVYNEVYYNTVNTSGLPPINGITPSDMQLATGSIAVPAFTFDGEFKDFKFSQENIKTKLYVSGPSIVGGITIKLTIPAPPSPAKELVNRKANNRASGLKGKKGTYNGNELPDGGIDVNGLPFDGSQINLTYTIYVAKDTTIKAEWLSNNTSNVLVELAIWLPFEFTTNKNGAEIKLPVNLFPEGDLFGRESTDSNNTVTDMLESLSFAMKMNKRDTFKLVRLSVESKGISIENPITSDSLEFAIDEKTMKAINTPANFPFAPKLKLIFNNGGGLSFPRNFAITEIAFKAKLNHTIDLPGGKN
jgi:hypothetical protein